MSRLYQVLVAVLLCLGCADLRRPEKGPGSAVWVETSSGPLAASDLARLGEAGLREVYVTAASLEPGSPEGPLVRKALPELPASVPVTLAIDGDWPEDLGDDPEQLAAGVTEAMRQLRFDVEAEGLVPTGFHLDLRKVDSLGRYAEFLSRLRRDLESSLFISTSVARSWLSSSELGEVCAAVDFVVPFLYGQRIYESEDGGAWDFVELETKLRVFEELDEPYQLGIVGLGTASHLGVQGGVKARRTRLSLQEILWNRDLKLRPGFTLEGVNRRVYAAIAERPTRGGSWNLQAGEGIRVVRAATADLEELKRLLAAWEVPRHLGEVYYRLPGPEERLSLTVENLLNALAPAAASPQLEFGVSLQRRTARGWLVRVSISNRNGEITELSLVDSNYIQARVIGGLVGRVKAGDFYRFELYRTDDGEAPERDFRQPDLVRFHLPILEGQQEVTSGDVEVKLAGEPVLELVGHFLLADGRSLQLGPVIWRAGRFEDDPEP